MVTDPYEADRYHFEHNNFSRILHKTSATSECGSNDWWEVTSSSGSIQRFGCRLLANSRMMHPNVTDVFAWYVDEVQDANGNIVRN